MDHLSVTNSLGNLSTTTANSSQDNLLPCPTSPSSTTTTTNNNRRIGRQHQHHPLASSSCSSMPTTTTTTTSSSMGSYNSSSSISAGDSVLSLVELRAPLLMTQLSSSSLSSRDALLPAKLAKFRRVSALSLIILLPLVILLPNYLNKLSSLHCHYSSLVSIIDQHRNSNL